jgi:hypothetical protein
VPSKSKDLSSNTLITKRRERGKEGRRKEKEEHVVHLGDFLPLSIYM